MTPAAETLVMPRTDEAAGPPSRRQAQADSERPSGSEQ